MEGGTEAQVIRKVLRIIGLAVACIILIVALMRGVGAFVVLAIMVKKSPLPWWILWPLVAALIYLFIKMWQIRHQRQD